MNICDFCPSDRRFADSFLQIPPHNGHPCCSALHFPLSGRVRDSHPLVHNVIYHTAEDLHRVRKNLLVDIEDPAVTRSGLVGEDAHECRLSALFLNAVHHIGDVLAAAVFAAEILSHRHVKLFLADSLHPLHYQALLLYHLFQSLQ